MMRLAVVHLRPSHLYCLLFQTLNPTLRALQRGYASCHYLHWLRPEACRKKFPTSLHGNFDDGPIGRHAPFGMVTRTGGQADQKE
jgi:hypothetical protein